MVSEVFQLVLDCALLHDSGMLVLQCDGRKRKDVSACKWQLEKLVSAGD